MAEGPDPTDRGQSSAEPDPGGADPPPRRFAVERLRVEVHRHADAAGAAMARAVADAMRTDPAGEPEARAELPMVFASAPSQDAFLAVLTVLPALPWPRVRAFHLDEYVGLDPEHPAAFSRYLRERLGARVPLGAFDPLRGDAAALGRTLEDEARRYAAALASHPLRIACLGIGENGHLAFNDPAVADPHDPEPVKRVRLDEASRHQQVHDGCFASLDEVPREALTLTLPTILAAHRLFVVVPGTRKAEAVRAALRDPVGMHCPATVLRAHPDATLYLDEASAVLLDA